jgi:hypothetical protein
MLSVDQAVLMVIDVQGKLAQLMHDRDLLFRNLQILIQGAKILEIPILWLEQNPAGLGPTVPAVASLLPEERPIPKMSFGAGGCPAPMQSLRNSGRRQVVLAGIEAHVCIYLTAADLIREGYKVEVIADAVSSRSPKNKEIGLNKIAALGGGISCTETVLFELLQRAEGERFKRIGKVLREQ